MCECGHGRSKHHHGWACGLECIYCEICGCPEHNEVSPVDMDNEDYHNENGQFRGGA